MVNSLMRVQQKKKHLKAVIVLVGGPDVGKSTTLILLSKMLLDDSFFYYEEKKQRRSQDRRMVMKVDQRVVGIGTAGDSEKHLEDNFKFFSKQRCDIGITAARGSLQRKCINLAKKYLTKLSWVIKPDMETDYGRREVALVCAEKIRSALKKHRIVEILVDLKHT